MRERRDRPFARDDAASRARRDLERRRRREPAGRFFHALGLIGSVGWPIVLLATGGALLGRYLDLRTGAGVRFTLSLIVIGTTLGTWMAFRSLRGAS